MDRISNTAATVSDIHAPEAGHAVEQTLAFRIPNIDAVTSHHDPSPMSRQLFGVGKRMEIMCRVELLQDNRFICCRGRGFIVHDGIIHAFITIESRPQSYPSKL